MDYIFFIYGFSYFLLASVSWDLVGAPGERLKWRYMVLAALLLGVAEWMSLAALDIGDFGAFKILRTAMRILSFILLFEFGGASLRDMGTPYPRIWIYPTIFLMMGAAGIFAGIDGLYAAARYLLAFPAGLLSGCALFKESGRSGQRRSLALDYLGIMMISLGLSAGLFVPRAEYFPTYILNEELFVEVFGFPVQSLRTFITLFAALGFWVLSPNYGKSEKTSLTRRWLIPCATVLILATGFLLSERIESDIESEQRQFLMDQALAVADAISDDSLKTLSFTAKDKENPEFKRLCEQMKAYSDAIMPAFGVETKFLSIYSMIMRNGREIIFGPESIDERDTIASSPGTVYIKPPDEVKSAFRLGEPQAAGPFVDEYGVFVSAFAPVFSSKTGDIALVIGMDIEAADWQATIAHRRFLVIMFTMTLTILLLAGYRLMEFRKRRPNWMLSHVETVLSIVIGVILTVGTVLLAHDFELHFWRANFISTAWTQGKITADSLREAEITSGDLFGFPMRNAWLKREGFRVFFDLFQLEVDKPPLFVSTSARGSIDNTNKSFSRFERGDLFVSLPIFTSNRTYALVAYPDSAYLNSLPAWSSWATGLAGMLLTLFISFIITRRISLEREVMNRTMELTIKTQELDRYFTSSLDMLCIADLSGHFRRLNPEWEKTLGYSISELEGQVFLDFVHPEDLDSALNAVSELSAGEDVMSFANRYRCKNGSYRWIEWRSKLVDGLIYAVARDITKRKLAEDKLKESNERFRKLFEYSPVAYQSLNEQGDYIDVNPELCEMLGYSRDELLGRSFGDFWTEETRNIFPEKFSDFKFKGSVKADLQLVCKDGAVITVTLTGKIQHDIYGEFERTHCILHNITERKQIEDALRETNRRLEETTERANEMTAQAEMANVAKSEFLANMSHEIRTPMNGVIGMTGLLLDTELSLEQRQYAEIVRTSGESLLALINDILDFSKIEAGKLDLEILDFDLRTTMEDTTEMLGLRAQEKNLELICLIDPEVPSFLRGDPGRLRQILINLGGNAVKFTHKGEIVMHISLIEESEDEVALRFDIRDTGIGISKEKLSMLFSPFTQVDASTTRKYGGSGLGLAISKQLTELMKGNIGVESDENKGSNFWFTAIFGKQSQISSAEPVKIGNLRGIKVLIVDDNETNRILVMTLLKMWGCNFEEVENGEAALVELLKAQRNGDPYHIALLDMLMPEMDGAELCRRIKEKPEIAEVKLVMMTSLAQRGDAARMEQMGFSGYLTKPLRQSQLKDCLSMLIGLDNNDKNVNPLSMLTRHNIAESRKKRIRILLAEDNHTNQIVALKILEKLGYRADAVSDGKEAISALQNIPYDLVLMDCQMPEMDGFDATRHIRRGKSGVINPDIPVIAMTAHAMKGDSDRCIASGMNDYLAKPVLPSALAEMLDKWLSTRGHLDTSRYGEENQSTANAPAVFDFDSLIGRMMGDKDAALVITDAFMEDMPGQINILMDLIAKGETKRAGEQAHKLKGAAANVGAEILHEDLLEMEEAGRNGDIGKLNVMMPFLGEHFYQLKTAMEETRKINLGGI